MAANHFTEGTTKPIVLKGAKGNDKLKSVSSDLKLGGGFKPAL